MFFCSPSLAPLFGVFVLFLLFVLALLLFFLVIVLNYLLILLGRLDWLRLDGRRLFLERLLLDLNGLLFLSIFFNGLFDILGLLFLFDIFFFFDHWLRGWCIFLSLLGSGSSC